jgi:hypothetical protein
MPSFLASGVPEYPAGIYTAPNSSTAMGATSLPVVVWWWSRVVLIGELSQICLPSSPGPGASPGRRARSCRHHREPMAEAAADLVVRAAADPNSRLHYASGADAGWMVADGAALATFEDHGHTMRSALNWPVHAPADATWG